MNAQTSVEKSLASAMASAFAEIAAATKSAENPAFKQGAKVSKYADLNSVIAAIKPALINHGLYFTQHCHPSETGVIVETVIGHASGEEKSLGSLYVPANNKNAHGFGSALTYARRYGLVTGFGVPVEDDDGNVATSTVEEAAPVEPPKPITDDQRDLIQTMAPAAGKTTQGICQAYRVSDLTKLNETQAANIIARLQADAKKEPVNA